MKYDSEIADIIIKKAGWVLLKLRKLTAIIAIGALSLSSWQALAIQGRGNSKNACTPHVTDAEIQAQNLSEISCKAELTSLKCDEFFETADERKEFERQCPRSKEERQINGGDLGAVCLRQMLNPTIDSIKGVAAFIAAGMRASAENQQKFISECEAAPDFKAKILKTIPDYSGFTREQIDKFPCPQLVGDFQDNEARQKEYQVNQRAETAYKNYVSTSHTNDDSEVAKNPFLGFINHNQDKWKCLNQAGHYQMTCYGFFSVVDPTMLAGGAGAAAKGLRLAKLFERAAGGSKAIAETTALVGNSATDLARGRVAIEAPNASAGSNIRDFFKKFFKPINEPATAKSSDVIKQTNKDIEKLKKLGVSFHATREETILEGNVNTWKTTRMNDASGEAPNYGQVIQVDRLPPPGKATGPDTNAFLHPEMAAYKEKLEAMGYQLVVDSSLPFSGAGAYFWEYSRVVALRPDSNWQIFIHEFQHAEFNYYLNDKFSRLQTTIGSGGSVNDVLSPATIRAIGPDRVKKLQSLLERELPETAVNESLSVDAELKLMGFRRYIPMIGTGTEKYALRHQITELNAITEKGGTLTPIQNASLTAAKLKYAALWANDVGGAAGAGALVVTSEQSAINYLMSRPSQDPNTYAQIVYNDRGQVIAQKPDGKWAQLQESDAAPAEQPAPTTSSISERPVRTPAPAIFSNRVFNTQAKPRVKTASKKSNRPSMRRTSNDE